MKSLGKRSEGARLERIKASPRWAGERFRNVHPVAPGLRDPNVSMPSLGEPIEPAHEQDIEPWWRTVDKNRQKPEPRTPAVGTLPKAMPWTID